MKELSEYKSEIFRRSDEKKRQIKKRRRIAVGVGIPLSLCCVVTVMMLTGFPPSTKGDMAPNMEAACDQNATMERPVEHFRITDPVDAAMVLNILQDKDPEYTLNKEQFDQQDQLADRTEPGCYLLTVECSDGSILHYRIMEQEAYCETNGERVILTDGQAEQLYHFLTQAEKPE